MASLIDGGRVVVTGASSGIGRAMAELIAPRTKHLVLVARRKDRLEALAKVMRETHAGLTVTVIASDLADPDARKILVEEITKAVGEVDVLVNNAGLGDLGVFDRSKLDKQIFMIRLNVEALVELTHAFLPSMVARRSGSILMVSSGFGLSVMPGVATYAATKHFVTGFTEALALDLAGTGVHVGQLCPGPVKTEFEEQMGNFTGQKVPGFLELSAESCAKAGIAVIDRRRHLLIPHILIWFSLVMAKYSPRWMARLLMKPIGKRLRREELARKR